MNQQLETFDSLYIIAPPHLLGSLRNHLPQAVQNRIELEIAKNVVDEPAPALRKRILSELGVKDFP